MNALYFLEGRNEKGENMYFASEQGKQARFTYIPSDLIFEILGCETIEEQCKVARRFLETADTSIWNENIKFPKMTNCHVLVRIFKD